MRKYDRLYFFEQYKQLVSKLSQSQLDGIEYLLGKMESDTELTTEMIAYILASVKHETKHTYEPIYEGGPKNYFRYLIGKLGNKNFEMAYMYRGRGYIQITGYENYLKFKRYLGYDLIKNPDLALVQDISFNIMITGLKQGLFTGHKLSDTFTSEEYNFYYSRRIINSLDKAELITAYARNILECLKLNPDA